MKNKFSSVIFVSNVPISDKVYQDFFADEILASNISVEFWDLTPLYNKIPHTNTQNKKPNITTFKQKKDLVEKIENFQAFSDTLFISNITYTYRFLLIYKLLSKKACNLGFFARGALPDFGQKKRFGILRKIIDSRRFGKNLLMFYALFLKKLGFTKTIDYIFQAGSEGIKVLGLGYNKDLHDAKQIIGINYFDYDNYLNSLNTPTIQECPKSIVFLDEYLPYHPDFDVLKMEKVDPISYYKELNNCFDFIENKTGFKTVIAAHPKSEYKVNPFNERLIVRGETLKLVKSADLILAHASSSLAMAVCAGKKVLLLDSDLFKNPNRGYLHFFIRGFSESLGLTVINISQTNFNFKISDIRINYRKYEEYSIKFLTSEKSKNSQSKLVFVNFLKNEF